MPYSKTDDARIEKHFFRIGGDVLKMIVNIPLYEVMFIFLTEGYLELHEFGSIIIIIILSIKCVLLFKVVHDYFNICN